MDLHEFFIIAKKALKLIKTKTRIKTKPVL